MNVLERQARFTLMVIIITVCLYLAIVACIGFHPAAMAAFGFTGLLGLTGLIGRKERKAGKIIMDERDREISQKASIVAYSVFWLFFVACLMAPFFIYGPNAKITIGVGVPALFVGISGIMVYFVRSLVIVILYRRDVNA